MKRISLSLLAALLFTGGCSLQRQQAPAIEISLPETYIEGRDAEGGEAPPTRWWEAFSDEGLNKLVDETLTSNLDLSLAWARVDQLQAAVSSVAASQMPSLTLGGQGSLDHQPGIASSHTGVNARLSLEAAYEIDVWDKLESRESAARFAQEASLEEIESLYLGLAARCVDLYYLAVEQRAQLDLTDRTAASFQETLARIEDRYRQGLVPALDIYQARQNLSLAQSRRPQIESALAATEHALSLLLGRYPGRDTFGGMALLPPTPSALPAGLPSELLARRPDVRAAWLRLQASDATVAAAVADRFPSFNLMAGFGLVRTSLAAGDVTGIFWNFLGGITEPLFDGGRRQAAVEQSEAALRESAAGYRIAALRAFGEVEDALAANAAIEARLIRLQERRAATEESVRLSTERYLQGLSEYLPVLTSQIFHFDAESQLLSARRQHISDRVSLARALGGTWPAEEVEKRRKKETVKETQAEEEDKGL